MRLSNLINIMNSIINILLKKNNEIEQLNNNEHDRKHTTEKIDKIDQQHTEHIENNQYTTKPDNNNNEHDHQNTTEKNNEINQPDKNVLIDENQTNLKDKNSSNNLSIAEIKSKLEQDIKIIKPLSDDKKTVEDKNEKKKNSGFIPDKPPLPKDDLIIQKPEQPIFKTLPKFVLITPPPLLKTPPPLYQPPPPESKLSPPPLLNPPALITTPPPPESPERESKKEKKSRY